MTATQVALSAQSLVKLVSKDGKSLEGEIISVIRGDVQFRRKDGQSFVVKSTVFDEPTQKMIEEWAEANRYANILELKASKKLKDMGKQEGEFGEMFHSKQAVYGITLTNSGTEDLKRIQVRYQIYVNQPLLGDKASGKKTVDVVEGELLYAFISAGSTQTQNSDPADYFNAQVGVENYNYGPNTPKEVDGKVLGLKMEILKDKKVVKTVYEPVELQKFVEEFLEKQSD